MKIEILNSALLTGLYDGEALVVQSTTATTEIVEGVTATKSASKTLWAGGTMTYSIVIDNESEISYNAPTIIDTIDSRLTLVENSVKLNGETRAYTFTDGVLSVLIDTVAAGSSATLTFDVSIV